jgi:hypothetical protein
VRSDSIPVADPAPSLHVGRPVPLAGQRVHVPGIGETVAVLAVCKWECVEIAGRVIEGVGGTYSDSQFMKASLTP